MSGMSDCRGTIQFTDQLFYIHCNAGCNAPRRVVSKITRENQKITWKDFKEIRQKINKQQNALSATKSCELANLERHQGSASGSKGQLVEARVD